MIENSYKILTDQGVLGVCLVLAISANVALFLWVKKLVKENREDRERLAKENREDRERYSIVLEKQAASFLEKIQDANQAQKEAAANQSKIVIALERIESDQRQILDYQRKN